MSAASIKGDLVHYEKFGRLGRPVILLHGWIGSWRYWEATMTNLMSSFNLYALDLFGFGDTSKNPEKYTLEHQIFLLDEFMRGLGIQKTALVGHGLGALVATNFAQRYPERVARLLLVSPPLFDPGDLDRRMQAGRKLLQAQSQPAPAEEDYSPSSPTIMSASAAMRAALIEAARTRGTGVPVPPQPYEATINRAAVLETPNKNPLRNIITDGGLEPLLAKCFKKSDPFYPRINLIDIAKTDSRALTGSVQTFDAGKMLDMLRMLTQPTCIIHGVDDPVMPAPSEEVLNYITVDKEHLTLPILLPNVRHFPMLEDDRFVTLTKDFLETPDLSKVAFKERWRRRTR